jgi:uncharacterized protein YjbI with pentapeptide repeats
MSEQDGRQATAIQRPNTTDPGTWKAYWKDQGQEWRTAPEIDTERQQCLSGRRSIIPEIDKGIYPFKDIKLSLADVEWLLATHENGRGPVDWSDASQRARKGLDLRGADLCQVNLQYLLLARLQGGLDELESVEATKEQRKMAAVLMEGVNLLGAHLEGAILRKAVLEEAFLATAHLEAANLKGASLQMAFFNDGTYPQDILLGDEKSGFILLNDVRWRDVNLAAVKWSHLKILGEEQKARQKILNGKVKDKDLRLEEFEQAVRANRQLANILQTQGLNEHAARFAYRAQLLQRKVLWFQHKFGQYLFSMLLTLLSGYGYRIWRILAAYIVMVSLFALAYFVLGMHLSPHLHLDQAFLESITAFHGGVFLEQFNPDTPQIWFTALEAIAGLIIEGVFIAMLIQRFFGK